MHKNRMFKGLQNKICHFIKTKFYEQNQLLPSVQEDTWCVEEIESPNNKYNKIRIKINKYRNE